MACKCKGICKDFIGYRHGQFRFHVEGKAFCSTCNYKLDTDNLLCPCCSAKYRRSRRKDYPHLKRGYRIPHTLVVPRK